jgi:hypothetical protein
MDGETPAAAVAYAEFRRLEDLMEEMVASSPEGIAAQIECMRESFDEGWLDASKKHTVDGVPLAFLDVILAGLGRIAQ